MYGSADLILTRPWLWAGRPLLGGFGGLALDVDDVGYRSGKVVSLRGRALGGSVGVELVPRRAVVEWLT